VENSYARLSGSQLSRAIARRIRLPTSQMGGTRDERGRLSTTSCEIMPVVECRPALYIVLVFGVISPEQSELLDLYASKLSLRVADFCGNDCL